MGRFSSRLHCNSGRVVGRNPLPVASTGHVADPLFIFQIPSYRLANSTLKCFTGTPAEFALNLACVHRVTPVVSGTVFHKCNQAASRRTAAPRQFVHDVADCLYYVDIPLLIPATDVIRLPHTSSGERGRNR